MSRQSKPLYVGVDLESGSPGGSDARYTIVAVDSDGSFVAKHEGVHLPRLIRLLWEIRPRALAVDNVYELARNTNGLVRILSMMPPDLDVVQVTMQDGEFLDIREAARRAGIRIEGGKLSPAKTALLAATLASMGLGTKIRALEEKTIISVAKGRSGSAGGWSQQRYQRKVRASVAAVVNEIRELLEREGLDYDLQLRKSKGGVESALFIVYAGPDRVKKLLPHTGDDVVVKVRHVYRSKLLLPSRQEQGQPRRFLIVGIDPGITTGLAVIDINGNVIHVSSGRGMDRAKVAEIVSRLGRPVIVAVDVSNPPEAAKRLASLWGASLFTPPQDLTPREKRELALRAGVDIDDSHARDALAAAYKAYLALKSKLDNVERRIEELGLDVDVESIKAEVARGASLADALERAIAEKLEQSEEAGGEKREGRKNAKEPDIARYVEAIESLKIERESLIREIQRLKKRIEELESELEKMRTEAAREALKDRLLAGMRASIDSLTAKISALERELEKAKAEAEDLKNALRLVAGGEYIVVRRLEKLTTSAIKESIAIYGPLRRGEAVYVESQDSFNLDAVKTLSEAGVTTVILNEEFGPLYNVLVKRSLKVVTAKEAGLKNIGGFTLAKRDVIARASQGQESRSSRTSMVDIDSIIDEYRRERMRNITLKSGMKRHGAHGARATP